MHKLVQYLSELNSDDVNWGIWVNPQDTEAFRIGEFNFENGGKLDDWICIGNFDELSFASQSNIEALKIFLDDNSTENNFASIKYKRKTIVRIDSLIDLYKNNVLDSNFCNFLEAEIEEIIRELAIRAAEFFVFFELPEIFAQTKKEELEKCK